jgi:long-chain acyl-CoA synthetase
VTAAVNLATIVEAHPDDSLALIDGARLVTYAELRRLVAAARGGLLASGVVPGDRVAIVLPTSVDFVVSYLAVLGSGAAAVPLNPLSPPAELARELATVRPALVIAGGDEERGAAPGLAYPGHTACDLTALSLRAAPGIAAGIVDRSETDAAALLFTSGTAGFPKAAVLTHASLRSNLDQMEMRAGLALSPDDVSLLLVPVFHIFGLNAVLGLSLFVGSAAVLVERFDAPGSLALIGEKAVTVVPAVPSAFAAWSSLAEVTGDEFAGVRLAVSGASALAEELAARFFERFGLRIWQGYGLTEASPTVTFPEVSGGKYRAGSIGTALPGVELRIVDVDGEEVVAGDPGELLVRGPNVFAGYFEDPGATRHVLDRAGWLHTGDIAVMSDDASLTLIDRSKDLIIVSGFNVYPAEVEEVLAAHPAVSDVAVTGVPDASTGEAVRAFVVPRAELWPDDADEPLEPSLDDLARFALGHLARYKCPTQVSFVRELPRGLTGKPLRRALG